MPCCRSSAERPVAPPATCLEASSPAVGCRRQQHSPSALPPPPSGALVAGPLLTLKSEPYVYTGLAPYSPLNDLKPHPERETLSKIF